MKKEFREEWNTWNRRYLIDIFQETKLYSISIRRYLVTVYYINTAQGLHYMCYQYREDYTL